VSDPALSPIEAQTHRLIASRYPPVGIFDSVASADDALEAMLLESLTNDRLVIPVQRLQLIPDHEMVFGQPGAHIIMAAFLHADPNGGRFTNPSLGAWYASFEIETAIDETVHHHTRRLALSDAGYRQTIQMRDLVVKVHGQFHDVRGLQRDRSELYQPDDYSQSQALGLALREGGSNGICYDSVRRAGGTNLVVYKPRLLLGHEQGDHYQYQWTGAPVPSVVKITNVERS
jgi:RES domain-containing protein